jgi:hypothetical protein
MCRICNGNLPNPEFNNFRDRVLKASKNASSLDDFVKNAIILDRVRFTTGAEWEKPNINRAIIQHIFNNSNPSMGLLLFILCCWLDLLAPYDRVWSKYLQQASDWISGRGNIPRGRFRLTKEHCCLQDRPSKDLGT